MAERSEGATVEALLALGRSLAGLDPLHEEPAVVFRPLEVPAEAPRSEAG